MTQFAIHAIATICLAQAGDAFHIGNVVFRVRAIAVEGSTIAIADVNGDDRLDVISAAAQLSVQFGDGRGGLHRGAEVAAGENPTDLAFADINNDGSIDVVVANHDVHYVTILLGDGLGGFAPSEQSPFTVDVDPHPHDVALSDLDGDGNVDLLIDHSPRGSSAPGLRRDGGGVLALPGDGDGGFARPGKIIDGGGAPYRGFAVGDVNGDRQPDIVLPLDDEVGVLLNSSDPATFGFERVGPIGAASPFAVRLGDLNADRLLDLIAAAGEDSSDVAVFLGDGSGQFEPADQSPIQFARGGKNITTGDFNGDGISDAAIAAYHSDEVLIVLGGKEKFRTAHLSVDDHPWGLATGDLNGDGRDDLIVVSDGARQGRLFLSVSE